jgi:hypothetical protein
MAGTCHIEAVSLVHPPGRTHPHIGRVRLTDGTIESRAQVIRYIRQGWNYVTWAAGVPAARVIVAGCPICGSGDYITTEPDWTTGNNLLDLPRF